MNGTAAGCSSCDPFLLEPGEANLPSCSEVVFVSAPSRIHGLVWLPAVIVSPSVMFHAHLCPRSWVQMAGIMCSLVQRVIVGTLLMLSRSPGCGSLVHGKACHTSNNLGKSSSGHSPPNFSQRNHIWGVFILNGMQGLWAFCSCCRIIGLKYQPQPQANSIFSHSPAPPCLLL